MIRPARPADIPAIYQLIRDLASYEKALASVTGSEEQLRRALLAEPPAVLAHVAEHDGQVAGFALWYLEVSPPGRPATASTWRTCTSSQSCAGTAWAGPCWPSWPG